MANAPYKKYSDKKLLDPIVPKKRDVSAREIPEDLHFRLPLQIRPQMALALAADPIHAIEIIRPLVLESGGTDRRVRRLVVEEEAPYGRPIWIGDARPRELPNAIEINNDNGEKVFEAI
jgi:hypothetical protein